MSATHPEIAGLPPWGRCPGIKAADGCPFRALSRGGRRCGRCRVALAASKKPKEHPRGKPALTKTPGGRYGVEGIKDHACEWPYGEGKCRGRCRPYVAEHGKWWMKAGR